MTVGKVRVWVNVSGVINHFAFQDIFFFFFLSSQGPLPFLCEGYIVKVVQAKHKLMHHVSQHLHPHDILSLNYNTSSPHTLFTEDSC